MFVEFLSKLNDWGVPATLEAKLDVTNTRILLVVEVGVMLTLNPVMSTKDVDVLENPSFLNVLTTCNTVPAVADVRIVPVNAGSVSVFVPATAGAAIVTCPDVSPVKTSEAISIL
tara:strand:- start:317 stop:661 length:345 start_codon:yes stop_codon:yes gene_type:complete